MRKKKDMQMGYAHGKNKVHSMGYAGGIQSVVGMLANDEGRDQLKKLAEDTIAGQVFGFQDGMMPMGYAYGNKMVSPLGYSYGTPSMSYSASFDALPPEERKEEITATLPKPIEHHQMVEQPNVIKDTVAPAIGQEIGKDVTEKATQKFASKFGEEGVKGAVGEAVGQGVGGAAGSLATNLLTKGEISEGDLANAAIQAGVTAVAGPLAGLLTGGFLEDGTTEVTDYKPLPDGGVADFEHSKLTKQVNEDAREEFEKRMKEGLANNYREGSDFVTDEELALRKMVMRGVKDQAKGQIQNFISENPTIERAVAPLAVIRNLQKQYSNTQIPLGQVAGFNVSGGEDGLAANNRFGKIQYNPDGNRFSAKFAIPLN